ncbi:MAG: sigma-70 family RNA polymerase sigma factor, partial [Planctomycetota bacterium]
PVYQTVFRLVGGRYGDEVEDICQEVFLKIYRSLSRFDPERGVKFSTWVYTFVKNHCFDVLKKRRLSVVHPDSMTDGDDGGGYEFPSQEPRPADRALATELGNEIAAAVARLPDDQRLVFVLREYQNLDYREISEVAGCSEGTVKSRLYRAKEALRGQLKKYVLR